MAGISPLVPSLASLRVPFRTFTSSNVPDDGRFRKYSAAQLQKLRFLAEAPQRRLWVHSEHDFFITYAGGRMNPGTLFCCLTI